MPTKTCFVIAPIGDAGTPVRKRSDKIYANLIEPVASECGYTAIRADKIATPGLITNQVMQHVRDAPLVVADLTGHNPNVFYELALRHALRKPLVQLIEKGEKLPFDVLPMRTVFVDHRNRSSLEMAKCEMVRQVRAQEADPASLDTPILLGPLNVDILRSSSTQLHARKVNEAYERGTVQSRFFVEMLLHRLNLLNAAPSEDGYTVTRYIDDIPKARPFELRSKVMRQDYAAIFDVAFSTAGKTGRPIAFDTIIFRDVELWADDEYLRENKVLADRTNLRRLFLYEGAFFETGKRGKLSREQEQQLFGLFKGTMAHELEGWTWEAVNIASLDDGPKRALLGPDFNSPHVQSSAVIAEHTAVFIKLCEGRRVVHRFVHDEDGQSRGSVALYKREFGALFPKRKNQTERIQRFRDRLLREFAGRKAEIMKAYKHAEEAIQRHG